MYRESVLSTQMCLWNNKDLKIAAGLGRLQNPALQRTLGSSLWIHPGWENIIKGWRHQDLSVLTAPDLGSTLNLTSQSRGINRVVPCFSVQKVKSQRDKQRTCSAQEIIQALGAAGLEEKEMTLSDFTQQGFLAGAEESEIAFQTPREGGMFLPLSSLSLQPLVVCIISAPPSPTARLGKGISKWEINSVTHQNHPHHCGVTGFCLKVSL